MAYAVASAAVVRLTPNLDHDRQVRVRNDGPNAVLLSKDPAMTAAGAEDFSVAASGEETVDLAAGEALYAICASGNTASVEVI